jgi:hypothetical protein
VGVVKAAALSVWAVRDAPGVDRGIRRTAFLVCGI